MSRDFLCILTFTKVKEEQGLKDYKLHCFNGEPKIILVCSNRFSEGGTYEDFFDDEWNHLVVRELGHNNAPNVATRPKNFELMKQLATQLSENIPFVRVDFYEIDGKVYFGELTFYPVSGFEKFVPEKYGIELGSYIKLPWGGVILKEERCCIFLSI